MRDDGRKRRAFAGVALCILVLCKVTLGQDDAGDRQRRLAAVVVPSIKPATAHMEDSAATVRQPSRPASEPGSSLDPEAVRFGRAAFESSCTACHEAERAFGKSKSYAGWLATVRRMAAKDGADIRAGDVEPIAAYLAAVAGAGSGPAAGTDEGAGGWSF